MVFIVFQNSGCPANEVADDKSLVGFAQLTVIDNSKTSSTQPLASSQ